MAHCAGLGADPYEARGDRSDQRADRVVDQENAHRRLAIAEPLDQDRLHADEGCRRQGDQGGRLIGGGTGADQHQCADQCDRRRRPADWAHPLAEHRDRQDHRRQRAEEADRGGFGERHGGGRREHAGDAGPAAQRAAHMHGPRGTRKPRPQPDADDQHQGEREAEAAGGDLEGMQCAALDAAAERLREQRRHGDDRARADHHRRRPGQRRADTRVLCRHRRRLAQRRRRLAASAAAKRQIASTSCESCACSGAKLALFAPVRSSM